MLPDDATNYSLFRDCFSSALLQRVSIANPTKPRKKRGAKGRKGGQPSKQDSSLPIKDENDNDSKPDGDSSALADDLAEFIEVCLLAPLFVPSILKLL